MDIMHLYGQIQQNEDVIGSLTMDLKNMSDGKKRFDLANRILKIQDESRELNRKIKEIEEAK